jgi:hypothetical protein
MSRPERVDVHPHFLPLFHTARFAKPGHARALFSRST